MDTEHVHSDKAVQTEGFEDKIDEWLEWDKNPQTHEEIRLLRDFNAYPTLKQLLKTRLKFGTSGIRGSMGAGFTRMNDLVVIQTTQGLISYLESVHTEEQFKRRGVAIGFDARHNSKRFAELAAVAFLNRGIRVYLFPEVCPTPFLSFCVNVNKCAAGVMITASHHPKNDNGYKVYWENGVQLIPPHDKQIDAHILEHLEPWENAWDTSTIKQNQLLLRNPMIQVSGMYFKLLRRSVLAPEVNKAASMKITYTAMHGVCQRFMVEAFKAGNFEPMVVVKEQKDPNPEFPTLEFPNPEDRSSLSLAMEVADEKESTLVLATDPDGDRLAVAEKYQPYDEEEDCEGKAVWRMFTGNELAGLLAWWTLHNHRQRNQGSAELGDVYMIGSVVTTRLIQSMARVEGFNYEVAPAVGFTWIANRALELTQQGKTVLFGCDEPAGFMLNCPDILDKDGISSGLGVATLAAHLDAEGLTLSDKLHELYSTYGYHIGYNACLVGGDPQAVARMFHRLRHFCSEEGEGEEDDTVNSYPESLDYGTYRVETVRDFVTGYDSSRLVVVVEGEGEGEGEGEQEGEGAEKPQPLLGDPAHEMMEFVFDNGVSLALRGCGGRLYYYTDVCVPPGEEEVWTFRETLDEMIPAIVEEFFQPEVFGLTPPDA